ncbi:MAG TPA: SDR family oxidoreductase [Acidobacteriota bacterium]|nr:SDR family oxidoreductase [Acidobacteriota bacterium]
MKVLFLGGTGNISSACVKLALDKGHDVTIFNRGTSELKPDARCKQITGDRNDRVALEKLARNGKFDVVADFIAFTPDDVEADLAAFSGQVGHFLFISSATVYQKPPANYLISETTPLGNPFWEYARLKIQCEERFRQAYKKDRFPVTIVRPSYTFGPRWIPAAVGGHGYTNVYRLRQGKPIVSHGDGQSLWVMTFNTDFAQGFVGLFGQLRAIGEAFHITSDEVLTWDQIYQTIAEVAGEEPRIVHLPSEVIAAVHPPYAGTLLGDKAYSTVFDNSKIKRVVPEFKAKVSFRDGIVQSLAWYEADSKRQKIDETANKVLDRLVALHQEMMSKAQINN